jgi:hypothetical protein
LINTIGERTFSIFLVQLSSLAVKGTGSDFDGSKNLLTTLSLPPPIFPTALGGHVSTAVCTSALI